MIRISQEIIQGDCLDIMRTMADNSVDFIITGSPYGISFMNKEFDSDKGGRDKWVKWLSDIMKQVFRVMKNGKHTHDVIGLENEKVSSGKKLLQPIFRNGELISKVANNKEIRKHYFKQKSRFNPKLFSVDQKFNYPVKVSQKLKILASKTRKEIVKSYLDQNL